MARSALSRSLEQLRRHRALQRVEAGQDVRESQGGSRPYLGGSTAFISGCWPTGGGRRARAPKGASEERCNKKAEVIAMMRRAKGVTLAEIGEATGWQKHTIRGFVSILGSKGGEKVESTKNADGERSYHIAK